MVQSASVRHRHHPLKLLLNHETISNQPNLKKSLTNTTFAFKQVFNEDQNWLKKIKPRLLNTDDYSTASSALGEIRCYGDLLQASVKVQPISETNNANTPDFKAHKQGEEVLIEVRTKGYSKEESKRLEEHNQLEFNCEKNKETRVTPFGRAEKGENVTENAISKIAQIKQSEEQFSEDKPSILWINFQGELWQFGPNKNSIFPVRTSEGKLYSGEVWYAFYGYEGAPIFRGENNKEGAVQNLIHMKHKGRFRNDSCIDAVVISSPLTTMVAENISTQAPIPPWFWSKLIHVPQFKIEYSRLNWPSENLRKIIEIDKKLIKSFEKKISGNGNQTS